MKTALLKWEHYFFWGTPEARQARADAALEFRRAFDKFHRLYQETTERIRSSGTA